jgi:hypothetical protein
MTLARQGPAGCRRPRTRSLMPRYRSLIQHPTIQERTGQGDTTPTRHGPRGWSRPTMEWRMLPVWPLAHGLRGVTTRRGIWREEYQRKHGVLCRLAQTPRPPRQLTRTRPEIPCPQSRPRTLPRPLCEHRHPPRRVRRPPLGRTQTDLVRLRGHPYRATSLRLHHQPAITPPCQLSQGT